MPNIVILMAMILVMAICPFTGANPWKCHISIRLPGKGYGFHGFIPKAISVSDPFEPLDQCALGRFSWLDVPDLDIVLFGPRTESGDVDSGPLSTLIVVGAPLHSISLSSSLVVLLALSEVSMVDIRASQLWSSITLNTLNDFPFIRLSYEVGIPCDITVHGKNVGALDPFRQPSLSLPANVEPHGNIDPVNSFVVPAMAHCPEHVEHLLEPIGRVLFGRFSQGIGYTAILWLSLEAVIVDDKLRLTATQARLIPKPSSLARYPTAFRFSAALELFFDKVLRGIVLEGKIGVHMLELCQFRLHFLHFLELVDLHATIFCLPVVKGRLAYAISR